ncbi:MAG TPA: DUF3892 domain-containing protein, partial [Steroidobacteraceae bacterium]
QGEGTMASLQVTCINKTNRTSPHERISHIGGAGWKYTESDAIGYIESRMHTFHVTAGGNTVRVIVATRLGRKYLKTERDGEIPDNLLSLPECR